MKYMKMPVIFAGHGSPMNAIENTSYTLGWEEAARRIPRPKAILAVSAHWVTVGTRINDSVEPRQIYDMGGFPKELYELKYQPPGSPELAQKVRQLLKDQVVVDNTWGIDHGTWSILCRMYPGADIPVVQLSLDRKASREEHYRLGRLISPLRDEGVLIFASGNVVHNLSLIDWGLEGGYPWAQKFDAAVRDSVLERRYEEVFNPVVPSAPLPDEHFLPLLYAIGASRAEDEIRVFNEGCLMGSLSMTSYLIE